MVYVNPVPLIIKQAEAKTPKTIEEKIEFWAGFYGADKELSLKIAQAESGLNPLAKNASSSAAGVYQFIDSTFSKKCIAEYRLASSLSDKLDPDINIRCGNKLLADEGIVHWLESKPYWDTTRDTTRDTTPTSNSSPDAVLSQQRALKRLIILYHILQGMQTHLEETGGLASP